VRCWKEALDLRDEEEDKTYIVMSSVELGVTLLVIAVRMLNAVRGYLLIKDTLLDVEYLALRTDSVDKNIHVKQMRS